MALRPSSSRAAVPTSCASGASGFMASHLSRSAVHVRFWHLADIDSDPRHFRSRWESGHPDLAGERLLMTQSGRAEGLRIGLMFRLNLRDAARLPIADVLLADPDVRP